METGGLFTKQIAGNANSKARTNYFAGAVRSQHRE
jgi:hypothetical protein